MQVSDTSQELQSVLYRTPRGEVFVYFFNEETWVDALVSVMCQVEDPELDFDGVDGERVADAIRQSVCLRRSRKRFRKHVDDVSNAICQGA